MNYQKNVNRFASYSLVLSIETSCDETSLTLFLSPDFDSIDNLNDYQLINSQKVLFQLVSSQIEVHKEYGGVVPEIGARLHAFTIHSLCKALLKGGIQRLRDIYAHEDVKNTPQSLVITSFQPALGLSKEEINTLFLNIYQLSLEELEQNPTMLFKALSLIAVTTNPGLPSALRVGKEFAKTIAFFADQTYHNSPEIIEVNHLNGHICSAFFDLQ